MVPEAICSPQHLPALQANRLTSTDTRRDIEVESSSAYRHCPQA